MVREDVPGPDVDEFAEPDRVIAALSETTGRSLLAVQHPHRTPEALADGLTLERALPAARATLAVLLRTHYRPVEDVLAPYTVDGPDGSAAGLLCLVDPAVGRHMEEVYPDLVAERARMLAGLGSATSAAMLVPTDSGDAFTAAVREAIDTAGPPVVSTVDSTGRRHRMWLLDHDAELLDTAGAGPLLVADGNHRVAASAAAGLDGMLALVTAGPDIRIGAFHRVLTGTGLDADTLAAAWRRHGLTVHETDGEAPRPNHVVVRCPGRIMVIELPPPDPAEPTPRIDHGVVENLLLHKALGLDPAGPRVRPLPEGRPAPSDADAVLLLAPVPLDDVKAVHGDKRRMPRKCTFFTPKPRSGLLLADLR